MKKITINSDSSLLFSGFMLLSRHELYSPSLSAFFICGDKARIGVRSYIMASCMTVDLASLHSSPKPDSYKIFSYIIHLSTSGGQPDVDKYTGYEKIL